MRGDFILFFLCLFFFSSFVKAQDLPNIGFIYRYEFIYDNGGFEDKPNTNSLKQSVNLKVTQELEHNFSYKLLSALDPTKKLCAGMPIRESYLSWEHSEALSIRMGCQKINQGGYDYLSRTIHTRAPTGGIYALPLLAYNYALTLDFNLWGNIEVQIIDDVKKDKSETGKDSRTSLYSNTENSLTPLLAWQGRDGGFQPLLQLGVYDRLKSAFISLGFKTEIADVFKLQGDIFYDRFYLVTIAKNEIHTTLSMKGTWVGSHYWHPYFYLRSYDNKQPTDQDGNSSKTMIDDNLMVYSVGAKWVCDSKALCPFINIDYSVKKLIGSDSDIYEDSQWDILAGINGEI